MKTINQILAILLFASIAIISGIHGSLFPSFFSLILLMALLLTSIPVSRFIFRNRAEWCVFAFPIGFIFHAVLLSFVAAIFGIHRAPIAVYVLVMIAAAIIYFVRKSRRRIMSILKNPMRKARKVVEFGGFILVIALAVNDRTHCFGSIAQSRSGDAARICLPCLLRC